MWIARQYIEKGLFDLVEAHVKSHVVSRDFYGPLFENTRAILELLVEHSELDRVFSLYRAAIKHRLSALKAEIAIRNRSQTGSHAWNASKKWVEVYLPTIRNMIEEYKALLADTHSLDPEVHAFVQSIEDVDLPQK